MDMDKPDEREGKLGDNTNSARQYDLYTSPEIYNQISPIRSPVIPERNCGQTNADNNYQSYIQEFSRTTEQTGITLANNDTKQQCGALYSSNEHFLPKDPQKSDYNAVNTTIHPLSHHNDNSSNGERVQSIQSVQNYDNSGSSRNHSNFYENKHPSKNNSRASSVELRDPGYNNTYSNRPRPSSSASTCQSESETEEEGESSCCEGKYRKIETPTGYLSQRTPTDTRRRLFNSEPRRSPGSVNTSGDGKFWTFTIAKHHLSRFPTDTSHSPSFIRFDHGDHFHFLYTATTDSNSHRQLRRICKFMYALPAGFAEATSTKQPVRYIWRFIEYCVRFGLGTVNRFGYKADSKINNVMQKINSMPIPEITENTEPCRQYAEEQKDKFKKNRQFKNITHTLTDIIEKNNIQTQTDWDLKIDIKTKMQLMAEYGLRVGNYVQTILRINRAEITKQIKLKTFFNIYEEILMKDALTEYDIKGTDWLQYLFTENNINMIEFFAWHEIIKTHRYTKINTIIFHGPTNAGKSMLLELLVKPLNPEEIPRERDNSSFHLDQLPAATVATFEEPLITPSNVGTWKLLMEGKPIKTDIKHKDKERINRIPIWITTASPIDNNVDNNEKAQLKQRYKSFQFTKQIEHNIAQNNYTPLNKCPIYLLTKHIAALYVANYHTILQKIHELDAQYTLSDDLLPINTQCKNLINEGLLTRLYLPLNQNASNETPLQLETRQE